MSRLSGNWDLEPTLNTFCNQISIPIYNVESKTAIIFSTSEGKEGICFLSIKLPDQDAR